MKRRVISLTLTLVMLVTVCFSGTITANAYEPTGTEALMYQDVFTKSSNTYIIAKTGTATIQTDQANTLVTTTGAVALKYTTDFIVYDISAYPADKIVLNGFGDENWKFKVSFYNEKPTPEGGELTASDWASATPDYAPTVVTNNVTQKSGWWSKECVATPDAAYKYMMIAPEAQNENTNDWAQFYLDTLSFYKTGYKVFADDLAGTTLNSRITTTTGVNRNPTAGANGAAGAGNLQFTNSRTGYATLDISGLNANRIELITYGHAMASLYVEYTTDDETWLPYDLGTHERFHGWTVNYWYIKPATDWKKVRIQGEWTGTDTAQIRLHNIEVYGNNPVAMTSASETIEPAVGSTTANVTLSAKVYADNCTKVEFYTGATKIGETTTANDGVYTAECTLPSGVNNVYAKAYFDDATSADSETVTYTIGTPYKKGALMTPYDASKGFTSNDLSTYGTVNVSTGDASTIGISDGVLNFTKVKGFDFKTNSETASDYEVRMKFNSNFKSVLFFTFKYEDSNVITIKTTSGTADNNNSNIRVTKAGGWDDSTDVTIAEKVLKYKTDHVLTQRIHKIDSDNADVSVFVDGEFVGKSKITLTGGAFGKALSSVRVAVADIRNSEPLNDVSIKEFEVYKLIENSPGVKLLSEGGTVGLDPGASTANITLMAEAYGNCTGVTFDIDGSEVPGTQGSDTITYTATVPMSIGMHSVKAKAYYAGSPMIQTAPVEYDICTSFISGFKEDFSRTAGSTIVNGWYEDQALTTRSDLTINDNNLVIPSAKSINHKIDDIDMTSTEGEGNKYWLSTDFKLDANSSEGCFAGIKVGTATQALYSGGVCVKDDGKYYPYVAWNGEGSDGFITEKFDCVEDEFTNKNDDSNKPVISNIKFIDYSATGGADDTTRVSRNSADVATILFNREGVRKISFTFYGDVSANLSRLITVQASSDKASWSTIALNIPSVTGAGWKKFTIETSGTIPSSAKYIRVTLNNDDAIETYWYNIHLANITMDRAAVGDELGKKYSDTPLEVGRDYTAIMRLSQTDNTMRLYIREIGNTTDVPEIIEFKPLFRPTENMNVISVANDTNANMTVDNVICEKMTDATTGIFEEKFEVASADNYSTIKAAKDELTNCSEGVMKDLYSGILDVYWNANRGQIPNATYVSISNDIAGSAVNATVTLNDPGKNLKNVEYKWYIGDDLKKTAVDDTSYTIPTDAVGKTIKVEATPENHFGVIGTATENSIKVRASGGSAGGGSGGSSGSSGGGATTSVKPIEEPEDDERNDSQNPQGSQTTGASAFSDVTYHWAGKEITEMAKLGLVNGVGGNLFMPDATVARAEIAAIVERIAKEVADLDSDAEMQFTDIKKDDWFFDSVAFVVNAKIMDGVGDSFDPEANLTREQMAKVAVNMCNYMGVGEISEDLTVDYTDSAEISDWAVPYVEACTRMNLMNGVGDGAFAPRATLTRAEAAVIVYRIVNIINEVGADEAQE